LLVGALTTWTPTPGHRCSHSSGRCSSGVGSRGSSEPLNHRPPPGHLGPLSSARTCARLSPVATGGPCEPGYNARSRASRRLVRFLRESLDLTCGTAPRALRRRSWHWLLTSQTSSGRGHPNMHDLSVAAH
jgi:hypothetical protein